MLENKGVSTLKVLDLLFNTNRNERKNSDS